MIKKISVLIVLLFSVYAVSFADEQRKIKLNDSNHNKETLEIANLNIFVELTDVEENGNAKIGIEIENLDESRGLFLFHQAYNEKILKKMPIKIKYHKIFAGTNGKRVIDACSHIDQDIHIAPSRKETIAYLSGKDGETTTCSLPIYITNYKDKNYVLFEKHELVLLQKEFIELEIEVDLKPSATYYSLKDGCDQLLTEYDKIVFCTDKKHKPLLEEQKKNFQNKIDSLVNQIDSVINANGWFSSEKRYKLYQEQKERLTGLDLSKKEGNCGKHIVRHRCSYCRYTPQQVYQKLDDIYQRIYSSPDRSTIKAKLLREINAVYNCPNARSNWRRSEYKDRIIRHYNAINQF